MTLLMRDQENMEKGIKQGMEKGVKAMVSALRDLDIPEEIIEQKIREKFDFSSEEAKQYIHQ